MRFGSRNGLARPFSSSDNDVEQSDPGNAGRPQQPFGEVMTRQMSAVQIPTPRDERSERGSHSGPRAPGAMSALAVRVQGEFQEMPGLRLTVRQAARLFSVAPDVADAVLRELRCASVLARSDDGAFFIDR